MSLVSLLSIARSALLTQSRAMGVTAHNVANAQTPGYSRQRLDLQAAVPLITPLGTIGRGVTDAGVSRARSQFHDATYRHQSSLFSQSSTLGDVLRQVEAAFGEPSDDGLGGAMDALFGAFADLAGNPSSAVDREMVRQAADRLVRQLRGLDAAVAQTSQDALTRVRASVDQINALARDIADLNTQIMAAAGPEGSAPDLEDQRDRLIDRLAELVDTRVLERTDGSVAVIAADSLLVDGGMARAWEVRGAAGSIVIGGAGGGPAVNPRGGEVGGLVSLLNTELPTLRGRLDDLAAALVTETNAIHQTGFTPAGVTGTDFFDPAGLTAATIALSPAVAAGGSAIAASATGAAGDGAVALQLAGLGNVALAALGGDTVREFYATTVSTLGVAVQAADQDAASSQALMDRASAQRESVRGVSVDEEMVMLIAQQQAYAAAARLVQTADEMVQTLLQMI
jgi:flagellar hook-associated protein 1 FlgK